MGRQGHQKRGAPRTVQSRRFAAQRTEREDRETRRDLDEWLRVNLPRPLRRDVAAQ